MDYEKLNDGRHLANPVWATVDISKSGNLVLSVLWRALGDDGQPLAGHESARSIHVLAYADERRIADTIKARDRVMAWCPGWDGDPMWFAEHSDEFKSVTASIVVEHEQYNGRLTAKARFVDPPRSARSSAQPTTASREDIMAKFGRILKAAGGQKAKPVQSPAPAKAPAVPAAPERTSDREACWAAYSANNPEDTSGSGFWNLVGEVTHGEHPDLVTAAQWGLVLDRIEKPF